MKSTANCLIHWAQILSEHPERASDCNCWQHFGGEEWLLILSKQPQFAKCCRWQFVDEWNCPQGHHNWVELFSVQPQFADKLANWSILNDLEVSVILRSQPKLASYIGDVEKRGGKVVALVLKNNPEKMRLCKFEQLGSVDIREFVLEMDMINDDILTRLKWDRVSGEDWAAILSSKPDYSNRVADSQWQRFTVQDWGNLLEVQPQFKEQFNQFASDEVKRATELFRRR